MAAPALLQRQRPSAAGLLELPPVPQPEPQAEVQPRGATPTLRPSAGETYQPRVVQPPSVTRLFGEVLASVRGPAAATPTVEPDDSLGLVGDIAVVAVTQQLVGPGVLQRVLEAAMRGFIAEMGHQLAAGDPLAKFKASLEELAVPANFGQFVKGYVGGSTFGFISPVTDLLGIPALAEQLPLIAFRLQSAEYRALGAVAQWLATEAQSVGEAFADLNREALGKLAAELLRDPAKLDELLTAVEAEVVRGAGGAGHLAAQQVVQYFTTKEEEKPHETMGQVFTTMTTEEWMGPFSLLTSKATRLRKAFFDTPWAEVGYNVGYAVGAVLSNVLLFVFSSGIGNAIAAIGAELGKLGTVLGRIGPLLARAGGVLVEFGGAISVVEAKIAAAITKLLTVVKPLGAVANPLLKLLERLQGFLRRLLGLPEHAAAALGARAGTAIVEETTARLPAGKAGTAVIEETGGAAAKGTVAPFARTTPPPKSTASEAIDAALKDIEPGTRGVTRIGPRAEPPLPAAPPQVAEVSAAVEEELSRAATGTGDVAGRPAGPDVPRAMAQGGGKKPVLTPIQGGAARPTTAPPSPVRPARPVSPKPPKVTVVRSATEAGTAAEARTAAEAGTAAEASAAEVGLAQERRLRNLAALKEPKWAPLRRGGYWVPEKIDPELTKIARELRASTGIGLEEFSRNNIAVAKVRVNGEVQYLSAANTPASVVGAEFGFHSEHHLLEEIRHLKAAGVNVELLQLYTERIPCPWCSELLDAYSNAQVFFSVRDRSFRGAALMKSYGVKPK